MSDRRHEIGFASALLLAGLLGFAAAEGLARSYEARAAARTVDWEAMSKLVASRTDDGIVRYRPGARHGGIVFNAYGFRGPEPDRPTAANHVRIAFLGDSKVMGANLPEAQTLSAQTVARLERLRPDCRFDYVTMAGPGYTLPFLARLWTETAPELEPDVAVVLAGSAKDVVAAGARRREAAAGPGDGGLGPLIAQSAAVRLLQRELTLLSPAASAEALGGQSFADLSARFGATLQQLDAALGETPTVAIAYRSRLGDVGAPGAQWLAARQIRQALPGVSVAQAKALSELLVRGMERHAAAAGWRYIDPIAALQGDDRYFSDRTHFSALGQARIAEAVSREVAAVVGPDCRRRGPA